MQDGNLAFPEMEQMELKYIRIYDTHGDIAQFQRHLLQTVYMRVNDPATRRIGHLRIWKRLETNPQFQDELLRLIPSLVLDKKYAHVYRNDDNY